MKRHLIVITCLATLAFGCKKTSQDILYSNEGTELTHSRGCASQEVLIRQLNEDPELASSMNRIEEFIEYARQHPESNKLVNGYIQIPVVVNVLYNTPAQNISTAQIQSQIDVLNKDFSATNSDYGNTPQIFQGVRASDTKIRFVLDAIVRKQTNKSSWTTNDAMKQVKRGGINATSPTTKLNMWCCNMGGGILGYAQFPGGKAETDGVVIDDNAFGNTGTAAAPYGLGRTATHEIGHWLNLRHIWGDATCGNDYVDDTPVHNTSNGGCPAYPHYSTCTGKPVEMTMNYMDYTYDQCMYMFSAGQAVRMNATFGTGGGRNSFAQP